MGVISVRFSEKEEKILKYLSEYYDEDKSSLLKHSLLDLYEDIKDLSFIESFEKREKRNKVKFIKADPALARLK